jgi:hypothetical protein
LGWYMKNSNNIITNKRTPHNATHIKILWPAKAQIHNKLLLEFKTKRYAMFSSWLDSSAIEENTPGWSTVFLSSQNSHMISVRKEIWIEIIRLSYCCCM